MNISSNHNGIGYTILVEGILGADWSDWFTGLRVAPHGERETMITGYVPDQSALFAILTRLQALNVALVSVQRLPHAPSLEQSDSVVQG
ncbi:MAG: hypothetical protein HGA45_28195 [Chloroflexales bacterium]|nr:hypothetical protein [Chloroflexales bacterium]